MSMKTQIGIANIFPCLRYQDAPAALDWLNRAFGFEPSEVTPGPNGTIAHAELSLGPGVVMVGSMRDDALGSITSTGQPGNHSIYVYVADVDDHYQHAIAAGAEVVYELADTGYGSREYTVRDLEGYLWSFGTYLPGQSDEG